MTPYFAQLHHFSLIPVPVLFENVPSFLLNTHDPLRRKQNPQRQILPLDSGFSGYPPHQSIGFPHKLTPIVQMHMSMDKKLRMIFFYKLIKYVLFFIAYDFFFYFLLFLLFTLCALLFSRSIKYL